MQQWQTMGRPGYAGRNRDKRRRENDQRYGKGQWRIAWQIGERLGSNAEAVMVYEDAYVVFMQQRPELLELLVGEAYDVYDDAPSNVGSGLDYTIQETDRTHLQDIAIRRSLVRLGREFQGGQLIQIRDSRGDHALSKLLSPGQVPFHRPDWIVEPELTGWWQPQSVEAFYQSNKLLQVKL